MLLPTLLFLNLASQVKPLRLTCQLRDLRYLNTSANLFSLLAYDEETVSVLPRLLLSDYGAFKDAYLNAELQEEALLSIYKHFINEPRVQHLVLPLQLFFQHPWLLQQLNEDWKMYNPSYYETQQGSPFLLDEPWRSRILETSLKNPNKQAGNLGNLIVWSGMPDAWMTDDTLLLINEAMIQNWAASQSWDLAIITVVFSGSCSTNFDAFFSRFPDIEHDLFLTWKLFLESSDHGESYYESILLSLLRSLGDKPGGVKAFWHSRLLSVAIISAGSTSSNYPLQSGLLKQFLKHYSVSDLKESMIKHLAYYIIDRHLLEEPLSNDIKVKLTEIHYLFPTLQPLTFEAQSLWSYWQSRLRIGHPLTPPPQPCTWSTVLGFFSDQLQKWSQFEAYIPPRHFQRPFFLVDAQETIYESTEMIRFLGTISNMIVSLPDSPFVLGNSPGRYDLQSDVPLAEKVCQGIAALILVGLVYGHQKNLFRLSRKTWDRLRSADIDENPNYRIISQKLQVFDIFKYIGDITSLETAH